MGTREHLRWVLPHDEEPLLDALARLHVAGQDAVAEGSRLRRHVPGARAAGAGLGPAVGTGAEVLEEPAARLRPGPRQAPWPTTRRSPPEERSARNGLANRQLTIR